MLKILLFFQSDHDIVCRCPENFNGDPKLLCSPLGTPRVGCKAVSECSKTESCINEKCVSPCNCGENAECFITNHVPTCVCKSGYIGNPAHGCFKAGCESDNECENNKMCYNSECINPCLITDPCAISASCYGKNHQSGNFYN